MKGLRCENGAVNCIDPWTNAILEDNRGKLRLKRLEEIDPLMTRQSRNFCSNDCAISENPIGEGTVSGDIDNDAKMKLVCNPDKNSITSLAVLQNWIHCYHLSLALLFVLF